MASTDKSTTQYVRVTKCNLIYGKTRYSNTYQTFDNKSITKNHRK